MKITNDKDIRKINECSNKGIDLFVIDISDSRRFDKTRDKKYLEYIISIIKSKIKTPL